MENAIVDNQTFDQVELGQSLLTWLQVHTGVPEVLTFVHKRVYHPVGESTIQLLSDVFTLLPLFPEEVDETAKIDLERGHSSPHENLHVSVVVHTHKAISNIANNSGGSSSTISTYHKMLHTLTKRAEHDNIDDVVDLFVV